MSINNVEGCTVLVTCLECGVREGRRGGLAIAVFHVATPHCTKIGAVPEAVGSRLCPKMH